MQDVNFTLKLVLPVVLMASLVACTSEKTDYKQLGFASEQEMKEIHAKGWHTKARYEEDTAKALGYANVEAMRAAILEKQRREMAATEQKNREQAAKEQLSKRNLLEQAIDPNYGNRDAWDKFTDSGGLNHANNFYGLPVAAIQVQWREGKVLLALMQVSSSVAPKKIRDSLSQACLMSEADWKIKSDGVFSGTATRGVLECRYIGTDESSSIEVYIQVKR